MYYQCFTSKLGREGIGSTSGALTGRHAGSYLEGTNCGALVKIERKILIEEHGYIARTGFHLSRSPSGQGGLNRAAAFFKLRHNGIVASDFTQPRGAYFEVWRHFVAKPEEFAKVVGTD